VHVSDFDDYVFSDRRRDLIEDFGHAALTGDAGTIRQLWSKYSADLGASRGIFVIDSIAFGRLPLPSDRDFGRSGFLRCWMAGDRLILIRQESEDFRFSSPIFCDTNFVSLCGAFSAGRDLGTTSDDFKKAVEELLPFASYASAYPYLLETADNPNRDKVRASFLGFACFKLTSPEHFQKTGRFVRPDEMSLPNEIADEAMKVTTGPDFATLAEWATNRFLWAKLTLTEAALIHFDQPQASAGSKLFALLEFLHNELARLHQFDIYAAFRFFELTSNEPFFRGLQRNSPNLNNVLRAMAWDLSHWRIILELLTVESWRSASVPFPIPHFLSFDRGFVSLLESFQFRGLIYDVDHRRPEFFFKRDLLEPVSKLLGKKCAKFYSRESMADRSQRAKSIGDSNEKLREVNSVLEGCLEGVITKR